MTRNLNIRADVGRKIARALESQQTEYRALVREACAAVDRCNARIARGTIQPPISTSAVFTESDLAWFRRSVRS